MGDGFDPWLLAGLLYLGSGIGLAAFSVATRLLGRASIEAPSRRRDLPWLALVVLTGGVAGPVLLMLGLQRIAASQATLLLNLEGLATMAIAWLFFREQVDRRLLFGAACILAGAVLLSWPSGGAGSLPAGALFIAGACLAWGIDNNLTRRLSAADPRRSCGPSPRLSPSSALPHSNSCLNFDAAPSDRRLILPFDRARDVRRWPMRRHRPLRR